MFVNRREITDIIRHELLFKQDKFKLTDGDKTSIANFLKSNLVIDSESNREENDHMTLEELDEKFENLPELDGTRFYEKGVLGAIEFVMYNEQGKIDEDQAKMMGKIASPVKLSYQVDKYRKQNVLNYILKVAKINPKRIVQDSDIQKFAYTVRNEMNKDQWFYYQIVDNDNRGDTHVGHFAKDELIENALHRIKHIAKNYPEVELEEQIITCDKLDFDTVKFPILQDIYDKDQARLSRAMNPDMLMDETN